MLDNTTKQKINTLRDILVGKVSDPKSQVEQITIAMFYKFMWDMDNELVNELGAKPKFFIDDFKKYSWEQLFAPSLGGEDMLNLYKEAVEKMENNPNIPSAFRDIFKRAYLPYNDPSTLRMFLKVINDGFHYSNSEMLGDAFEYLLSILGTQGDAGQFRTPRHIIDFITECVNPQKGDVICDPACGTAGFVISAYKHILKQNTDKTSGDLLSPNDKKKLGDNLIGLDIDPMMVKLALANMYLHGFNDPHITEYDSLTNEDRWNDTYDVVLANPPFMTPKGGIRPHKRFTTKANKAEVLFVDLIATHLSSNGRAGIVVPNGIVATTQNAYKSLRKLIIKDSLIAVISLPSGVFNPYSGVKTSILILDKEVSKKTNSILFLKVENDGFDLGAQRRAIDKNDLPNVVAALEGFKDSVNKGTDFDVENQEVDCVLVEKKEILENKDVILTENRYIKKEYVNLKYPLVTLGDSCTILNGSTPLKKEKSYWENGNVNWFTVADIKEQGRIIKDTKQKVTNLALENTNLKLLPKNTTLLCCTATVGEYAFSEIELATNQQFNGLVIKESFKEKITPKFLFILSSQFKEELIRISGKTTFNFVSVGTLKTLQIPLPPIEIQEQIVAEIEGYQKIIDGARMVVDNYKPTLSIKPHWEMVELGDIGKIRMCKRVFKHQTTHNGYVPFYKIGTFGGEPNAFISEELFNEYKTKFSYPKKGDILISTSGTIGKTVVFDGKPAYFQDSNIVWIANNEIKISNKFLNIYYQIINWIPAEGGTISRLYNNLIKETKIFCPSKSEQEDIVEQIEVEQEIVNSNKKLIALYEQKIQKRIAQVFGEDE